VDRQKAEQASAVNLHPKNKQVLDKANDLEQRMIDGWARPPDFKKPDEKDW
jgi:hypothetical protein